MRTVEKLHFNTEEDCRVVKFSEDIKICPDNTFIGENNCSISIVHTPIPSSPNLANNYSSENLDFPGPSKPEKETEPLSMIVKPPERQPKVHKNMAKCENTTLLSFMIKLYSCLFFQFFTSMCFTLYCSFKLKAIEPNQWLRLSFIVSLSIVLVTLIAILFLNRHLKSFYVQCLIYLLCSGCFAFIFGYLELTFKNFQIVGFLAMYQLISLIHVVYWIWRKNLNIMDQIRIVLAGSIAAFIVIVGILNQIAVSIAIEAVFLLFFFSFAVYESHSLAQGRFGFGHEDYLISSQMLFIDVFGAIYELVIWMSHYIY